MNALCSTLLHQRPSNRAPLCKSLLGTFPHLSQSLSKNKATGASVALWNGPCCSIKRPSSTLPSLKEQLPRSPCCFIQGLRWRSNQVKMLSVSESLSRPDGSLDYFSGPDGGQQSFYIDGSDQAVALCRPDGSLDNFSGPDGGQQSFYIYGSEQAVDKELQGNLEAPAPASDSPAKPGNNSKVIQPGKKIHPAKPGKTKKVPGRAKWMIQQLRSTTIDGIHNTLKRCAKIIQPRRTDWLYLMKEFKRAEDKELMLQIFEFVLLEESFEASVRDYTNLMLAYIEVGCYEAVERTVRVMEERDIYPDLFFFTVLIDMYGKTGRLDSVKETFSEMRLFGLEPDIIVYCALVDAYCSLGRPMEAELLLKEIETAKLPFKIEIFISLMRGYGSLGQAQEAERIFQLLQLKCIFPDRRACSALMDAYIKADDLEGAVHVFENMLFEGIRPLDKSMVRLITAFQNRGLLEHATNMLLKLESKSFKPGLETLTSFSGWLDQLGLMEEAELLEDEIKRRDRRSNAKYAER